MACRWITVFACLISVYSPSSGQDAHIHKPIRKGRGGIPSRTVEHWDQATVGFRHDEDRDHEARRSKIDTGPFLSGSINYQARWFGKSQMVFKGIAIRLGQKQQASVCFDTEMLQQRIGWSEGWLRFGPAYMGLIQPPTVVGGIDFESTGPGWSYRGSFDDPRQPLRKAPSVTLGRLPKQWAHYKGLYQHGNRIVLEYTVGDTLVRETPWIEERGNQFAYSRTFEIDPHPSDLQLQLGDGLHAHLVTDTDTSLEEVGERTVVTIPASDAKRTIKLLFAGKNQLNGDQFDRIVEGAAPAEDVSALCQPGPTLWNEEIKTKGVLGNNDGPFAVDTLTLPFDNPYNSLMFIGSHGFLRNGDAVVSTVYGDVWLVSGISEDLNELVWKRFATGLYQPLGMLVIDDTIYVTCRDQIGILHDRNGDGEMDYLQNLNNEGQVTWNPHEFVTNLERDSHGNFYVVKSDTGGITDHDGCVLRISPDGSELSVVATGFRNSNGLTVAPDDTIFVSPQEGDWTPGSAIFVVKEGGFHGHLGAHHEDEPPTRYEPPMCWIPRFADNSSGSHVWVTSDNWGPMRDQLLHLSAGQCRMLMVLQERSETMNQGGTVPFDIEFDSSVMRGRFNPHDGQLYVSGLRSWVSRAAKDGCFHRVRYTGQKVHFPKQVRTYANGLAITFYEPLDERSVEQPAAYKVKRWNYKWTNEYGSLHYRVDEADEVGEDDVEVLSATLLDDRTLFLELDDMCPVNQLTIDMKIRGADQTPISRSVYYTIHEIPDMEMDPTRLRRLARENVLRKDDPSLATGLKLRFQSSSPTETLPSAVDRHSKVDARVSRLAAVAVKRGVAPTPFLENGPFTVTATGYVNAEWPGRYRFRLDSNGTARLRVNGQDVDDRTDVELAGGLNKFQLSYASPPLGDARFRVFWQSGLFPEEPIPPKSLYHKLDDPELAQSSQRRYGRELFARYQCLNCHEEPLNQADLMPELRMEAPDVRQLGNRLTATWMAKWIAEPHSLKPQSRMPQLLDPADAEDRQQVDDLIAYLQEALTSLNEAPKFNVVAEGGEVLYEELGCIACHRLSAPKEEDKYDRISLYYVAAKFRFGALYSFLRYPHQHHPASAMPDFRLSDDEASKLASFLRSKTEANVLPDRAGDGDAARGKKLFAELHCVRCHEEKPAQPLLASVFSAPRTNGCLSESPRDAPDFHLTKSQRSSLQDFLSSSRASLHSAADAEIAARLITGLRCHACHSRDQSPALLPTIVAEEGRGIAPGFVPSLTWTGEKLHSTWTSDFIAGKFADRLRPWLKARMPAFPAYADQLAHGLVAQHAVDAEKPAPVAVDAALARLGSQIVGEQGGLNCLQCHDENARPQDNQGNIAPAIQFKHSKDRLHYDYYQRFVLDPTRFEPRIRMPKISLNGETTALKDVLDGDARRQFDAVWHYIHGQ